MTYDPTKWNHEDVITSQKLNKIEKGLTDVAEIAIFGFGGAQQSSDGLTPFSYINAGDPMPSNPKKGDTVFIKDGNDFTIYSYDGEQWNIKVDPNLSQRLSDTLKEAKDSTDKAIADNNDQINNTIDEVAQEKIDLAIKDADFNENAQAMADKALVDAKANAAQVAQVALNSANQNIADAKKSLTDSISKEASNRASAVATANSQAQSYANQAKADAISAASSADGIIRTEISNSANSLSATIAQNKSSADSGISTAQTTAKAAVDGLEFKVSRTDYDKKTGELSSHINDVKDTADKSVQTIADIQEADGKRDSRISEVEHTAGEIKTTVSDLSTAQDKQSGSISTLQQRADGFDATVTKVNNLSIGGRNLYTDTKNFDNLASWWGSIVWTKTTDSYNGLAVMQTSNDWNGLSQYITVKKGDILTYSAYVKYISGTGISMLFWQLKNQTEGSYSTAITNPTYNVVTITDSWQRISVTAVATSDGYFRPRLERTNNNTNILQIAGIKVEKGNVATDWSPAPEDVQFDIAQVKVTADGVSSIVSDPTTGLSTRVQIAEGTLNTVKSTADGAMSKASQTANDVKQEISDRKTGDNNTLQSSKDFTQSTITSAVKGVNSTITQTSESLIAKINTKTDSDTVLSLLKNNWSIGITDNIGKITSGIVGNASQMSLISKNVTIDSPSTQITGTAWINSAMIQNGSIVNANIADAAITSAKIAQLDVAKLTGNTTSFIKSNWSSAYGNVSITPTNITLQSYTGDTLMSEFSVGDLGMTVKMPGISSFLDSTIINANGLSFQHSGGSYATVGVMDAGFTLERNPSGGAPMSIKIGDGVHNIANDMAFAITAAQNNGTSPQLIWAGADVGKISTKYRTWNNPQGFIIADNIKFSTWDNTASRVEFDDTVNFYNYAPVQVYGQRFSDGTTRALHLSGKEYGAKWFGFLSGGDQAGFGTDNTGDVQFFMKGKRYSLYAMLDRLHMR